MKYFGGNNTYTLENKIQKRITETDSAYHRQKETHNCQKPALAAL